MRAFVVENYGKDGPRAADVPEPTVGRRDVLVRVSAASINPLDKMTRNGEFKQLIKYKPPDVPTSGTDTQNVCLCRCSVVAGCRGAVDLMSPMRRVFPLKRQAAARCPRAIAGVVRRYRR